MKRPGPILVTDRFPQLRLRLIALLSDLSDQDWSLNTAAPRWSVKDVAAHLLGGDVGILSRCRDGFSPAAQPVPNFDGLVELVNRLNDEWVTAARRISPRALCELLEFTGPLVESYFASLDPFAIGQPVSWAGPDPAPVWFDVAREFTERWHHQQQIRDATGRPALYNPYFLAPVLDAFVRALPYTFRNTAAAEGAVIKFEISGQSGGSWFLERTPPGWELGLDADAAPEATVVLDENVAWRLFTKGMSGERARSRATIMGDSDLASQVFATIAVIA